MPDFLGPLLVAKVIALYTQNVKSSEPPSKHLIFSRFGTWKNCVPDPLHIYLQVLTEPLSPGN